MATEQIFKIPSAMYDGLITWSTTGQRNKQQFIDELWKQQGAELNAAMLQGRMTPTIEMVEVVRGMPAECGDGAFVGEAEHSSYHDNDNPASECDWDPALLQWITWMCDEAMWNTSLSVKDLLAEWETDGEFGDRYANQMRAAMRYDAANKSN